MTDIRRLARLKRTLDAKCELAENHMAMLLKERQQMLDDIVETVESLDRLAASSLNLVQLAFGRLSRLHRKKETVDEAIARAICEASKAKGHARRVGEGLGRLAADAERKSQAAELSEVVAAAVGGTASSKDQLLDWAVLDEETSDGGNPFD